MGKLEVGYLEAGHPTRSVRGHIWLSLVDPKLEVGVKISEAVSY